MPLVSVQYRYSIDTVSILYRYCIDTVSTLYRYSIDTVSLQYRYCRVSILYRYSVDTVSIQYRYCIETVSILYRYSIDAVSIVYRCRIDIISISNAPQSGDPATALGLKNKKIQFKKPPEKHQKSIQNQSKIDQKSIKNRPKSKSGGILEPSWRSLGGSWGVLEAFWVSWEV